VEANRAEGVKEGGTLMRFVNAIADNLRKDYAVSVETMMYHTEMPKITKPASNVLIQLVSDPDWRYALDDPGIALNRKSLAFFRQMKEEMGDGYMYNWIKLGTYGSTSYLDPRPNLRHIARNIRIMTDHGVKGYFCQTVQSRGTEMQPLRHYLLARAMWRPEVDSGETIREFCHLYYGAAAPDILRYIDFLHDAYGGKDRSYIKMADTTVHFDEDYIRTADRILAAAEAKALTAEEKMRVATCRLPVWKLKLDRAFGEVGKVLSLPVIWSFKPDPDDVGATEHWESEMSFDDWRTMRIDKHWTMQGEDHRGVAWYGTQFVMPRGSEGPHAIWFGAVDGDADIFINGVKVGEQKLPATSMWQHGFFIPLENALAPGVHTIVVRVFKPNWASGIWKAISIIDMSAPISDELREVGRRFIDVAEAAELKFLSESYGGPDTQTRKAYFPKIETFLTHSSAE